LNYIEPAKPGVKRRLQLVFERRGQFARVRINFVRLEERITGLERRGACVTYILQRFRLLIEGLMVVAGSSRL
jgi:hypothetical protein